MCTTLIVPGLNGSDEGHWQRHWLLDDPDSRLVDQDNWQCPVLEDWLDRLEAALATVESAYIVAHSLGCLLVANMASRPSAAKNQGRASGRTRSSRSRGGDASLYRPVRCVSAATACVSQPRRGQHERSLYGLRGARAQCKSVGSDLINLGAVGHINIASGYGRWPEGYALLERLKADGAPAKAVAGSRLRRLAALGDAHF